MKKKILIIGAGVAGKDVLREVKESLSSELEVIGFIDDDPFKYNLKIDEVPVLGGGRDLARITKQKKIDEVIIAIPSAEGIAIADYVRLCSEAKVGFKVVPRVKEIIEGKAHLGSLRKVEVADLMGRPIVKSDVVELSNFIKGKSILITGAAGSIGSELSRQVAAYKPRQLIFFDWWENGVFDLKAELGKLFPALNAHFIIGNIQDEKKVARIIETYKPNFIFHSAAYKHVPLMEENPDEAVKNNIFGTLNLAKAAKKFEVKKFVLISTDKATNPINVMGATKLITEGIGRMFNSKRTKFIAVRFGNVLGSLGSVVQIFRKQIQNGGPVTITDRRMTRFFMTIAEAAQLILKAGARGRGGELFVLDMGEPVKIVDLAENMIRLSGFIPGKDIKIIYTGKRKGEKIEESLFSEKEKKKLIKTSDKKIFITESLGIDISKIPEMLDSLPSFIEDKDNIGIRQKLSELIPSLKS